MPQKQQHRQEESVRCLEITLKYLLWPPQTYSCKPPLPHIHTLTSRQAGGPLGIMKKKSGVVLWRFSVLRCSPSKRGRRKHMPSSAFDSAVIGISISICRSPSERSCEGFQPGRLPPSARCICLLELACPCQAIVVNVSPHLAAVCRHRAHLSPGPLLGSPPKGSGHYSAETGRTGGPCGRNHQETTLPCVTFVGRHSCSWNNRD